MLRTRQVLRQHLQVPQTNLAGADRLSRSSLISGTIVSCRHICTLSSPTVLWYSYRRSRQDRCSTSFYRCLRQNWQMLTGFTGPHLSQRQLCPADTCTLSSHTVLWTKNVLQTRQLLCQALHLPRSRSTFILVSNYLETMFELFNFKCTCCLYGAGHNDFVAGNIHFEGHWNGWTLKIETFLGPEMATSEARVMIKIIPSKNHFKKQVQNW